MKRHDDHVAFHDGGEYIRSISPLIKRHFMIGTHCTFNGYFEAFLKVVSLAAPFPSPLRASMRLL